MSDVKIIVAGFSTDELALKTELYQKENQNVIINGNFDIWQRNTTFTNPTTGSYTADRFKILHNSTGSRIISRQQFNTVDRIPSVLNGHPSYYLRYTKTAVGSGNAYPGGSGTLDVLHQSVEGIFTLSGNVIVSFWIRPSLACTIYPYVTAFGLSAGGRLYNRANLGSIPDTGSIGDWVSAYSVNLLGGQWTRVSIPVILDSNFGISDIANLNFHGLGVNIGLPNQLSNNIDISGVCLEKGWDVTEKAPKSLHQELSACQRYYEKSYQQGAFAGTVTVTGATTLRCGANVGILGGIKVQTLYKQIKRTTPTVFIYDTSGNINKIQLYDSATDPQNQPCLIEESSDRGFYVTNSTQYTTNGTSINGMRYHFTADAEF